MQNNTPDTSPTDDLQAARRLVLESRWAALATVDSDGAPHASWVAYVPEPGSGNLLLHLSGLAAHTGNLLAEPRAALGISAVDSGVGDPQTLPRVTLQGRAEVLDRDSAAWSAAGKHYIERLPDAAPLFGFADFVLFRFVVVGGRYVGGFARAFDLGKDILDTADDPEDNE